MITVLLLSKFQAQTWATEDQYIQKFAPYAVEEMEKYKIPASITLAQGLLETGGGQSRLAQEGKNHFGIKCKEDWTGKTMKHTDDAPNECFRVYDDPKQSYEDHSKFLATRKYYVNLFKLDMKDYRSWAHGLKKAGYATNPRYAQILIGKIQRYQLDQFDNCDSKNVYLTILKLYPDLSNDAEFMAKTGTKKPEVVVVKPPMVAATPIKERLKSKEEILSAMLLKNHPNEGLPYVVVPADTDIYYISKKYNISESRLMRWNDLTQPYLKNGDIVFLDSKNSNGNIATYTCAAGDTMYTISQKFAIKLSKLYSKNRMEEGGQPKVGDLIYLQEKKPRD